MASTTSKACGKSVEMLYELGYANTPVLVFMSEETEQMLMTRLFHFVPKGIAGCQEQHMGEGQSMHAVARILRGAGDETFSNHNALPILLRKAQTFLSFSLENTKLRHWNPGNLSPSTLCTTKKKIDCSNAIYSDIGWRIFFVAPACFNSKIFRPALLMICRSYFGSPPTNFCSQVVAFVPKASLIDVQHVCQISG